MSPRASAPHWRRQLPDVAYIAPAMLLLLMFLLWPLLWVVGMSFTSWDGLGPIHWAGFATWSQLFADTTFRAALRNTLLWMALAGTVPVIAGFGLSLLFSKARHGLGPLGRTLAVLPLLLPMSVTAVSFRIIYNPNIGPLNQILGDLHLPRYDWLGDPNLALGSLFVLMLWASVGFSVLVFTGAIRSIDRAYLDVARAEGASLYRRLIHVIFPACRKTAALAVVVTIVVSSATVDLLYVVTTSSNDTIMLPLDMYNRAFQSANVSAGAADATIEVLIALILAAAVLWLAGSHPSMSGENATSIEPPSWSATVATAIVCVLLALPLLADVGAALTHGAQLITAPLIPWPPSFSAFGEAWNLGGMGSALITSALVGLAVVLLTYGVGLPAAYALSGRSLPVWLRRAIVGLLVFGLLLPGEPYLIPLEYLIQQLGINDIVGLILAESARELPIAILLLWIFMAALPTDVVGAAELDAGRGMTVLTRIFAPMTAPIGIAVAVWIFITSWSETTLPNIILNSASTAPVALATFAGRVDTQTNLLAAGSLILVAPVLVVLLLAYGPAARGLRLAGRNLTS